MVQLPKFGDSSQDASLFRGCFPSRKDVPQRNESDSQTELALVFAKAHVEPMLSVPKLKLQAALLAARAYKK